MLRSKSILLVFFQFHHGLSLQFLNSVFCQRFSFSSLPCSMIVMQYCYLECMSSQNFCVLDNSKIWIVVCMWQKVLLLMTCDPLLQAGVQAHFVAIICIVYVLEFNHMWTQILLDDGKVLHPDEGVKCLMYLFSSRNKFYINKILLVLACVFLTFPKYLTDVFVCLFTVLSSRH